MPSLAPLVQEVDAPRDWLQVEFLSDIHLQPSDTATYQAWRHYMNSAQCDALFILGDLFEVWVGDDVLNDPAHGLFWQQCVAILHQTSQRLPVHFMVGNRDFLAGSSLRAAAGLHGLSDPAVLDWGHTRWLLSHGDALCTDDQPYQAFRQQVRQSAWQTQFLSQPLPQRLAMAQEMRAASEARKTEYQQWVDVDDMAALQALQAHHCTTLIHGHTHRSAHHPLPNGCDRWVLSDWDASAPMPRLQVLSATRPHAGAALSLAPVSF
jgi:UDP-2,3-diacylglucosamine hydrolase